MSLYKEEEEAYSELRKKMGILAADASINPVEEYLNMTEKDFRNTNKEDCSTAQYVLSQYLNYLHEKQSAVEAALKRSRAEFSYQLSGVYNSYDSYMPHDLKIASACAEYENIKEKFEEIQNLEFIECEFKNKINHCEAVIKIFHGLTFSRGYN